jgi:hypothetical protein
VDLSTGKRIGFTQFISYSLLIHPVNKEFHQFPFVNKWERGGVLF